MIIITQDDVIKRIEQKFPSQPFKIIEYTRMTNPFTIQCLKYGIVKTYSSTANFLNSNRKGLCFCYNEKSSLKKHYENKEKILKIIKDKGYKLINFGYDDKNKKIYSCL